MAPPQHRVLTLTEPATASSDGGARAVGPASQNGISRLIQFWPAVLSFVASRILVLACLYVAPILDHTYSRSSFFTDWDGAHYLSIAQSGYPQLYPRGGGFNATAAFFPLLPLLMRGTHLATGLSEKSAGILIVNVVALVCLCVIWALIRDMLGPEVASRTAVLVAFWPASFVLTMIYNDGLLLALAAGCLLALYRQRWTTAGLLALLATATRPNALVLVLCCAWAAGAAWRQRRSWAPLVSVVLAPLGAVAYFAYLWVKLGSPKDWFTAEHKGWHQGFDFGHQWLADISVALHHPTNRVDLVASSLAGLVGIALVVWMLWLRLPPILTIYAAGVLILALCSGFGGSIPRFCLDAFPMFVAPASRLRATTYHVIVGMLAGGLILLFCVVELTRTTTP